MATTKTRTRPAVRLRPAPPLDPPYDDELTLVAWLRGAGDQLELDFTAAGGTPKASGAGYRTRTQRFDPAERTAVGSPVSAATATAETQRAARRFLDTCLEILNGYRPVAHARALTTPGLAMGLVEQFRAATERLPGMGRPAYPRQPASHLLRLLSLRVCEPKAGVAEAAAAIGNAGRTWALAFRLERCRGRWVAVVVRLV